MNERDIEAVRASIGSSRFRVEVVQTSLGRVIAKRQRPPRSVWRTRMVNALAGSFGVTLLRAVPAHGGARAQEIEIERLRSLRAAGVRVPEVLHVEADFFVLSELVGPSLVRLVERGGPAGFEAWRRGLATLTDTHARGGYLSHAFARNFIATDAGLAMIDFEDDPLAVMTLAEAQARDWLAYLHSTAWMLDTAPGVARDTAAAVLETESTEVRRLVQAASRRLAVLRFLPRSRSVFGREVVGIQAMAALFPMPDDSHAGAPA